MATYNGSKYIIRQINSIIPQLGNDDEIIISDDNSTDSTLDLLYAINDKRIKIIINKLKSGPVGNFQNALNNAKGDIIFLADQDDIWSQDKISTICKLLIDHDLVLSNCEVVDQDLKILIPSFFNFRGSRPGFWFNLYKNSYIGCCMGFRREVLNYVLPIPENIHMHDWWIGLLVETRGRIKFVEKPLMSYVRHGHNTSPTGEKTTYSTLKQLQNRLSMLWYIFKRGLV
ncbi:glycosyltransferase family 2 protein [Spirosoma migulaei]